MKITYLLLPDGDKLISYHRHDFKSKEIDEGFFAIDGGRDYTKLTGDMSKCKIIDCELEEVFDFIRKDVTFGFNPYLDKASISSISNGIIHFKHLETDEQLKENLIYNMLLLELKHRNESKTTKKE